MKFLVILLLFLQAAFAQILESPKPQSSFGTVMLGYQLVTSWLPSKKTVSYTHLINEKWSIEGEYSWATLNTRFIRLDLGEVTENRISLHARRYMTNSFHFLFGTVLSDFNARLGGGILDTFGNDLKASFGAQNLGVTLGMGNRWHFKKGLTVGIDWLRLNVPVSETEIDDNVLKRIGDDGERERVKDILRIFNRVPTFVVFGVAVGYTF